MPYTSNMRDSWVVAVQGMMSVPVCVCDRFFLTSELTFVEAAQARACKVTIRACAAISASWARKQIGDDVARAHAPNLRRRLSIPAFERAMKCRLVREAGAQSDLREREIAIVEMAPHRGLAYVLDQCAESNAARIQAPPQRAHAGVYLARDRREIGS